MAKQESNGTFSSLDEALLAAQRLVTGIGHDAKNEYANYQYTSSEAMIRGGRVALLQVGVVAERTSWTLEKESELGGTVVSTFRICHPSSKETREAVVPWPAIIGKGRPWDKAVAGALTTCWSYWLRDLLAIPRSDDTEMDKRDDSQYEPSKTPAPRKAGQAEIAKTINWICKKNTCEEVLIAIAKVDQRFAEGALDKSQLQSLLYVAYERGLNVSIDDDDRDALLDSLGKHKKDLSSDQYDGLLQKGREAHQHQQKEATDATDNKRRSEEEGGDETGDSTT